MIELSVIVPTFNERDNVTEMVRRLTSALDGLSWEVIFVDDNSPDGTADAVREIARCDRRVRCLHRFGRRGLSSACVEGILSSSAPYCAVMDGDLQHDEKILPRMLDTIKRENLDLVIGSRYVDGGSIGNWDTSRASISSMATKLSQFVVRADLADPMSGFFLLRREIVHEALPRLSNIGFKILIDICASIPRRCRYKEIPFQFRRRQAGRSKLDSQVAWEYLMLLLDKLIGRWIPPRFVVFCMVGSIGLLAHLTFVAVAYGALGIEFTISQAGATLFAMTGNFLLNNIFTYYDRRLRGWRLVAGLAKFLLACGIGVMANLSVASYIFYEQRLSWTPSAIAGALVSVVWNYVVTGFYTWNSRQHR